MQIEQMLLSVVKQARKAKRKTVKTVDYWWRTTEPQLFASFPNVSGIQLPRFPLTPDLCLLHPSPSKHDWIIALSSYTTSPVKAALLAWNWSVFSPETKSQMRQENCNNWPEAENYCPALKKKTNISSVHFVMTFPTMSLLKLWLRFIKYRIHKI